jgi:hypothetical protein
MTPSATAAEHREPSMPPQPSARLDDGLDPPAMQRILERFAALDALSSPDAQQEDMRIVLEQLEAMVPLIHAEHVPYQEALRAVEREGLLVRKDDPAHVLRSRMRELPLPISRPEGSQGNSAMIGPRGEGLAIALEGRARPKVLTAIVAFSPGGLEIRSVADSGLAGITRENRVFVRAVAGDLQPSQMRYLLLRFPRHLVPDEAIAGEDVVVPEDPDERRPQFVWRAYRLA